MTFGAMAAWQAALVLGGVAALATWLFLLKLRPPRRFVSSLMLWRRVLDESREQTLWERVRRAVSLAVTVLVALLLALAITAPSRRSASGSAGSDARVIVVVDSSWSMLAQTRSGETRWERAVTQARRLAAAAGNEVAIATTADGLVEGPTIDRTLIETALDRISPSGGDTTSWPRLAGGSPLPVVHFITDGAVPRPLEPGVIVHSVFEPAANVAITAFDVRRTLGAAHAGDAYLEVANYAPASQQVRITLTRGTAPLFDRQVDMASGEVLRQVLPIAHGADPVLRARVEADADALDADDEAVAWIQRARPLSVAIVGEQTAWLTPLFESDRDVRAVVVRPSAYPSGTERADAIIFDRWAPSDPPGRPALYIAPPLETPWLNDDEGKPLGPRLAREEQRPRWDAAESHPVLGGVDPFTLSIDRARAYASPALVAIARSSRGTPLVYVGDSPERRFVLLTFGAADSNLASAPAFPVLIGNALDWLVHPQSVSVASGHLRQPGLAVFEDSVATVTGPRGVAVPLVRVDKASVGLLRAPGLYVAQDGGARTAVAVNVGHPTLSNLTRTTLGTTARAHPVAAGGSGRPWWTYCAIVALALALAEWWTWQRRITV